MLLGVVNGHGGDVRQRCLSAINYSGEQPPTNEGVNNEMQQQKWRIKENGKI